MRRDGYRTFSPGKHDKHIVAPAQRWLSTWVDRNKCARGPTNEGPESVGRGSASAVKSRPSASTGEDA
jgi:hypothetical protein